MDPIHPIAPGPALPTAATPPVERLARISRERDRPAHERPAPRRREPPRAAPDEQDGEDDGGRPRVDVRV
jgi:hypothetical protein